MPRKPRAHTRSREAVKIARDAVKSVGCECERCPLGPNGPGGYKAWRPVLPENLNRPWLVLGQAPGSVEVQTGRPLVGPMGALVTNALERSGLTRPEVAFDNVIACEPETGDYKRMMARLRATNRKRKREGKEPWPTPAECCRPRLERVIEGKKGIIPLGKDAAAAVLGGSPKINDIRGTISFDGEGRKVAPTVASFLHKRRWLRIFRRDVKRAVKWFHGNLTWTDPHITITQDPQVIDRWLKRTRTVGKPPHRGLRAFDVETDGIHPMICNMRTLGIGTEFEALVIPIRDLDGTPLWDPVMEGYLAERIEAEFQRDEPWVGHNSGSFDRLVLETWGERTIGRRIFPKIHHDTVLMAAMINAEHPKTLGFCATVFSEEGTPAWKADHKATDSRSLQELAEYNGMDCAVQRRITPAMMQAVLDVDAWEPYANLQRFQAVCTGLHRVGMPVNVDKAQAMFAETRKQEDRALADVLAALEATGTPVEGYGKPKKKGDPCLFNPNSHDHVRDLLFVRWSLFPPATLSPKDAYTDADEFSTGKKVLMELQYDAQVNDLQQEFIRKLLVYKKISKRRSTLQKMTWRRPTGKRTEVRDDAGNVLYHYPEYEGHVFPSKDPGPIGRVHPSWNAHGTQVTRPSASRPNVVNVEKELRPLYEAPEGYVLVGADWSALHLRLIAAFWKIPRLVQASVEGLDPHALMCGVIYGDRFWKVDGHPDGPRGCLGDYTGTAGFMRKPIKAFQYAFVYRALASTIFRVMASYMKPDGTRAFPNLTEGEVASFREKTLTLEPEWEREWGRLIATWKRDGYIATPLLGRRCYFEDGYVEDGYLGDDDDGVRGNVGNGIINFEILGGEGDFASKVTSDFVDAVPFEYAGPGTGLINQNYDSLLACVREKDAKWVAGVMHDCMNVTINGIPMVANVGIGKTWKEVS